jgi:hypothetical protein
LKKILALSAFLCALCGSGFSQNLTTISGSNITDINGTKLAAGQVCFLITDQSDTPISVSIGGGGQALKRGYCSAVTAGVITGFTVPNPANTLPSGICYRVTVKDSSTGQEVLRYTLVSFTGATFNFDNYAPLNLGSAAPLSGNSVTGNLSVTGNVAATGTVIGSNIAGGQIATGTGTTNTLPKYTNGASAVIGNSSIADNGTTVSTSENVTVGGTLGVTGTSTLADVTMGAANTLSTSAVKQVSATASFGILDNAGVNHFFISGTSPFQNTFLQGNGSGNVFLGSAAKTSVADTTGNITMSGSTSGTTIIKASAVAGAGTTLTLPAATDTLIAKATTDTLTNKTFDTAGSGNIFKINGTTISANTGTGNNVLATSPTISGATLTTPLQGITCAGNCLGVIAGYARAVGQTAAISTTTLFTTGAADTLYVVSFGVTCKSASASATVIGNITWTDVSGTAYTAPTTTATCTTLTLTAQGSENVVIQAKAGTNVQYSTSITNTPTYDARVAVTQLGTN